METSKCIAVGAILAFLHTVTLMASLDAFATASYILYKDIMTIPIMITGVIDIIAIAGVLSYPYWVNMAEHIIVDLAVAMAEPDLDEDETDGDTE